MINVFSIKNKVVIITGAGRGIGYHLATNMAAHLAFVYCVDKKFSNTIPRNLTKYIFQKKCDVTERKNFQKICDEVFNKHRKIDVLINNAGVTFPTKKYHSLYPEKDWLETLRINLTASFYCSQAVIKHMIKNKSGSIINITSLNAELAFSRNPAYVASKGGLKMLGKALAKDWGIFGIRVNNLGPGYIKTDMTRKSFLNKKNRIERENQTMLDRWGEKDDLVGPCIFLASDASKYITGQDLYVDGGWTANGGIT